MAQKFTAKDLDKLQAEGKMKKYRIYIGIDTGTNTGFAVWEKADNPQWRNIETMPIHKAMKEVENWLKLENGGVFVRVEDARKRKWFGSSGREQLQGAGSIKRDAVIWEDYLKDLKVDFEMVAPKNNKTKLNSATFKKLTGWAKRTTEHSRDAAMLVWKF